VKRVALVLALLAVVLIVGLWLGGGERRPSSYATERAALSIRFSRTLLPFKVLFVVLLGALLLATLCGLGWGLVRWIHRRADTVYPDASGLYPLRETRVGGARIFHDPNRTLTGTTVYATGASQLLVRHAVPEGRPDLQARVTGQAQAAQALRAAVSSGGSLPSAQGLPPQAFNCSVARPLPEVQELPYEPSHIERLLLEDGEAAG